MSITFDINKKALQSMGDKPMALNTIKAVFDGRTKSTVESCGANHTNVIGNFAEPSTEEYLKDSPPTGKPGRSFPGVTAFSHGFMEAVHLSFSKHYPLILTPDSVWLTIAQGFGTHINANAEALRKQFVKHE